jgi:uncharacterized protein (DUF1499 family)
MASASKLGRWWHGTSPANPSKLAWAALVLAVLPALAALAAGYAHRTGALSFQTGFAVLRWGAWIAAAGAVLGIVALVRAATGARRRGWGPGLVALLVGAGFVAVPAYYYLVLPAVPRIHDISTDTDHPPAFVAVVPLRAGYPNPVDYDGPEIAAQQKQAYPDLATLHLAKPPAEVFAAALNTAQSLGFEIVNATPPEGRIEASQRSFFFGFVDDVVIRLEPDGTGTKVDVRSKSREGRSDFGVNAARIRKILAELKSRIG